ncbi:MAG: COG1683: Uncharacterized conserved protein / FIG143828: Hypothetical protein YbgA [uncultured Sulfurovum sp.]|uniref:Uncharacterized protein n=1 Tax=uncultured Sulfurovum sp. TaxID=269237 RepID=A0A6S6SFH0_9BACT|nr:MAG: COG1683: Uncharacterized conserved protein / FIG143828: Hypothetical protein YbgA [uncultured Sulfurovum sp.]
MLKSKVALSACLLGCTCRYDGNNNLNENLLILLDAYEIVPFCPEDHCFGTPRPTMDLVKNEDNVEAISNETQKNISRPIREYAQNFFRVNPNITLFIGKDRSPSCAVKSGKIYDVEKNLLDKKGTGLMAQVALDLGIESWDAETYEASHTS